MAAIKEDGPSHWAMIGASWIQTVAPQPVSLDGFYFNHISV
jgi:hypothetical protein